MNLAALIFNIYLRLVLWKKSLLNPVTLVSYLPVEFYIKNDNLLKRGGGDKG